ncbi:NEK protein kinase [Aphanomyces invadans]|uniref:non-specific serine/threonine protein kinase n=1 Tax=Aphanomyces invadans TaxID=157072 RepID=A0A024UFB2_9STRA|nr:NEK protein kinase [Aphanomyces invadans]ETW04944.1 NEK protein kinase [Aphanomyces invadans]|eukprot:XP_008866382.1 NEK protein kinase [Aphanomyces invadans]
MDKYRKLERIGKGSFGSAYLVEKRGEPGKQYVIKEIQIDPRDQKAAVREARLLAALDHPNIIACKEHFMLSPGQKILCIVTEYADGGDLRKLLKQYEAAGRRLDEDLVLDLLVQMCLALKHVHDRKILHRDVKPENIFLMQSHVVKLGDFGVAKVLSNTLACADTQTGTPYYTSPEICHGLRYNHKTDVWSLGCVLYEMITQMHAFDGRNQKQLFQNIAYGALDTAQLDHCSPRLKQLVISMLAKAPRDRPSINGILKTPLVRDRIHTFLSAQEMQNELAHTVLHGQHLFRKPPMTKATTSPRAMKHPAPPPPPIAVVRPIVRERHPAVRGYAAPTAAMRKRGEAMAAKKERVQALVAKQREQAEMRLIQEKKARLARKKAEMDRRNEALAARQARQKSPPKVPQDAAFALQAKLEARRQQLLEQQAVRDLPMMVPVKESRDRDADRLKMAEDIKEKKRLLKDVHPNSNDPILLVQVLKSPHDNHALPVPPPVLAAPSVMIPKVEAIFAPDTITLNSTVGSPKHAATPDSSLPLESQTDASDEETMSKADAPTNLAGDTDVQVDDIEATSRCNGKRSFEYERMVLHMKCVMEEELAEDPDDDDGDARTAEVDPADESGNDDDSSGVRLSNLAILQLPDFKAALKALWSNSPAKPDEVRGVMGPTSLSAAHVEDAAWLCRYMQGIVLGESASVQVD